ncbi:hypothetical protein HHI36_021379 [Cryptolaemus montrouzieri]|uniref:Elongation of very long chain fatty acids protein n=1 Tax=Cryptolaemus montrouzieri TaxID=559131 RepID=A0ABD2MWQ4_9CUCU
MFSFYDVMDNYNYLMEHVADQRTKDYWILTSPLKPILIFVIYLYLTKKFLPNLFKRISLIQGYSSLEKKICFCSPVDYSDTPESRLELDLVNWYYLLKVYDLLDTVFFVLRKRERQITFLHLYHHAMMVTFPWIGAKFVPGGSTIYIGVFNVIVHIVMYFYYAITLWNSGSKKNLWWKKHLTQLQLLQFFSLASMAIAILLNKDCSFPKGIVLLALVQNSFLIFLFGKFYYFAYIAPSNKDAELTKIKAS